MDQSSALLSASSHTGLLFNLLVVFLDSKTFQDADFSLVVQTRNFRSSTDPRAGQRLHKRRNASRATWKPWEVDQ